MFDLLGEMFESIDDEMIDDINADVSDGVLDADVHFGNTVEFPDGTVVTDPYESSQHVFYPTRSDYMDGTNGAVEW